MRGDSNSEPLNKLSHYIMLNNNFLKSFGFNKNIILLNSNKLNANAFLLREE